MYTTFADLDPGWDSEVQRKVQALGYIFSCTFQLIRVESDMLLKQCKVNFFVTVEWEIKNFGIHFLRNFVVDFDEIQSCHDRLVGWSWRWIYFVEVVFKGELQTWYDVRQD